MKAKEGEFVVSTGEAVVLLNVSVTPDDRAIRDWKERLRETRQRLQELPDSQQGAAESASSATA